MRNSTLKPGKPLARSPMPRSTKSPSASAGLLRVAAVQAKTRKPMRSRGMKGRPPTSDEQRFMDEIAALGCIACHKDGVTNPWISLHHIDGRTKPGAHKLVLPLCACHHQHDDADPVGRIGVHPHKARFEARYGAQHELLAECIAMIEGQKPLQAA